MHPRWSKSQKGMACVDLVAGMSLGQVAKKHGIPRGTIQDWAEELKQQTNQSDFEIKQKAFYNAYTAFGIGTMEMLAAQAKMLSDPDYCKEKSTQEIIEHSKFIRDTFRGFEARHGAVVGADALPQGSESADDEELVECEIVDESTEGDSGIRAVA